MSDLRRILEDFQEYVFHHDKKIFDHILPNARMTAEERALVYGEGFYLRLVEVLVEDYPMIQKLMGEEAFDKMGYEYTDAFLPNHFSVNVFGRNMGEFLRSQSKYDPFYAEMADFEWQLQQVLNTADAPQITLEDLTKVAPESWGFMQFSLHPSVHSFDFTYNVADVWRALNDKKKAPKFKLHSQPVAHMFWRFNLMGFFVPLDPQQAWMLHALREGKTFAEICEGLCEWIADDNVAPFAAQTLHNWISEGVCSELKVLEPIDA